MADLAELFRAFNARDWPTLDAVVDELFAPDFRLERPKRGAPPLDRDGYRRAVREQAEEHPDLTYEVEREMTGDDAVALTLHRRFRLAGREVVVPVCVVAERTDGRIHRIVEYAAAPYRA